MAFGPLKQSWGGTIEGLGVTDGVAARLACDVAVVASLGLGISDGMAARLACEVAVELSP